MTQLDDDRSAPRTEIMLADVLYPLVGHGRKIAQSAVLAVLITLVVTGIYFMIQPVTRTSTIQFRPVFEGASTGRYPNGLPFAVSDIVERSIVDEVFARNELEKYCPRETFQNGLSVQENSTELQLLSLEYQAKLADSRITAVDRQRLQDEYTNKRALVPVGYQLMFVAPAECSRMPAPVVAKALTDILEQWARESESKRGVLNMQVAILTPAVFDQPELNGDNLLVRADLLRTAITRVVTNIAAVQKLPGAEAIRGEKNGSFQEIKIELQDMIQARLDPLVAQAGHGLGPSATAWVQQSLQTAVIRESQAQERTEAYRQALREYSGLTPTPPAQRAATSDRAGGTGDVQTLTPQIDRTFVDKIVELSAANTKFRQDITREELVQATEAVDRSATVAQYRQLLSALGNPPLGASMTTDEVRKTLQQLTEQAKTATGRFNALYDQFSRVAFRIGPNLYRTSSPVESSTYRAFGVRDVGVFTGAMAILVPLVLTLLILARAHGRRLFVRSR